MNFRLVSRLLSGVLFLVSLSMGLCLGLAAYDRKLGIYDHGYSAFAVSFIVALIASTISYAIGFRARKDEMLRRDGVAIVSLGWILVAVFGALPFVLLDDSITLASAFFEATSGFTTTGSTILNEIESYPRSILLWRSLMQWIGGLGILVLFVALLSSLGVRGRSLMASETSLDLGNSPIARAGDLAKRMWIVYVSMTIFCWGFLLCFRSGGLIEISLFDSFLYTLTAVATGGFAPYDASVGYYQNIYLELTLSFFMLLSALSMLLLINMLWGNWKKRVGRAEAKYFGGLIVIAILLVTVNLWGKAGMPFLQALRESFFPVISMATSAGFSSTDYDQWPLFSQFVIALLMLVGGCSGSTAGGFKVIRLLILLQIIRHEIRKTYRPTVVSTVQIDGKKVGADTLYRLLAYFALLAVLFFLSVCVVAAMEPSISDLNTAFGAVVATFFNMGPGFGMVGPTDNFAALQDSTLLFLSLLMLMGRLEVFAFLVIFSRSFWTRY